MNTGLSGWLFKPSQRLWAGGGRKRLSVFIVISRSRLGSWANLLPLISLMERESWQALHALSPLQPNTEYDVCSTQDNMETGDTENYISLLFWYNDKSVPSAAHIHTQTTSANSHKEIIYAYCGYAPNYIMFSICLIMLEETILRTYLISELHDNLIKYHARCSDVQDQNTERMWEGGRPHMVGMSARSCPHCSLEFWKSN